MFYFQVWSQYLPNQAQNVTYVSRLQCMQAALSSQIEALARIYPNKRVGVVTFASDVVIYGDGQQDPHKFRHCKYLSEGAAREWSTVVIVIVIFIT